MPPLRCAPTAFKLFTAQLLKKHDLDPSVLSNFKLISKLTFLSKVLKNIVFKEILEKSYNHSFVRNLGVILDTAFKLDKQISSIVKTCFFYLRTRAKVKPCVPKRWFKMLQLYCCLFSVAAPTL